MTNVISYLSTIQRCDCTSPSRPLDQLRHSVFHFIWLHLAFWFPLNSNRPIRAKCHAKKKKTRVSSRSFWSWSFWSLKMKFQWMKRLYPQWPSMVGGFFFFLHKTWIWILRRSNHILQVHFVVAFSKYRLITQRHSPPFWPMEPWPGNFNLTCDKIFFLDRKHPVRDRLAVTRPHYHLSNWRNGRLDR